MTRKVLVIEDNCDIAHLVEMHLRDMGCQVQLAHDGNTGLDLARNGGFDLVILDLMLPGLDGLEICKRIRSGPTYTPILMLTSKASEADRVVGLELGADDYLPKPFGIRELLARVKAIFRRVDAMAQGDAEPQESISVHDLSINVAKRQVTLGGNAVELTAKEFDLLAFFARHPGRVYSRAQLLDQIWGHGYEGYEHTVNSHINRLRAKIEQDPAHPAYILTVWGVGYKFTDAPSSNG